MLIDLSDNTIGKDKVFPIDGILPKEQSEMEAFIQGSVLTWITINPNEPFHIGILYGDQNKDWAGTPLQRLYDNHINAGKSVDEAYKQAAMNAGTLLKNVLIGYEGKNFQLDDSEKAKNKTGRNKYSYMK